MPSRNTVEAFAAEVEAGRFVEAIEGFYAETASMQENTDAPRVGRDALVAGEKQVLAAFAASTGRRLGPILIDGDHVAIRWLFEFTTRDGATRTLEEIAWQRWEGEKIVEEQFFYDPKQLGR
ncbi:MAG TPA: nuclear transport factor 2 family protein [Caulobacteraceae bacterium]|nr:nuclear transport factor 2 family protein [Caulobacteraceae bacterium]